MTDLCEQAKTPRHVAFKRVICPGMEAEFHTRLDGAANFFKHADRDAVELQPAGAPRGCGMQTRQLPARRC
jgi:hypothetical protein